MLFNFSKNVFDLSGNMLLDQSGPVTFKRVAILALLENGQISVEDKYKRFKLAQKMESGPDVIDVNIDEIKELKDRVESFGSTLVVGRFNEFINSPIQIVETVSSGEVG